MNQKIPKWILLLAGLLYFSSCYQSVEGCLDPFATNFNASADDDCCCEYPRLSFNTDWKYDTISFNENTILENELGQFFSIKRLDILISEISPSYENELFPLKDSITLQTFDDDTVSIENNLSYLSSSTTTTYSGKFHSYGTIDQIQFRGGVQDQILNLFSISSDHNLSNAKTLIQRNDIDSIYSLYCVIHRDTIDSLPNDTLTLPYYSNLGIANLSCIIENDLGNERIIPVLADLKKCFHSMDMNWNNQQMTTWLEDHVIQIFSCNTQ